MKRKHELEDVTLYVEQRQPTEEEERLFRAFMQKRKATQSKTKKTVQPVSAKKQSRSTVLV
jgi:hypothetical protein